MAAGFKLDRRREADMLDFLGERLAVSVAAATASRPLAIDGALSSAGANTEFMELLERAGPYGAGHPEPRFAFPAHRVSRVRIINDEHVRCTLSAANGSRLEAAAFGVGDTPLAKLLREAEGTKLHVAGHLRRDTWNGRDGVELIVEDAAEVAGSR
jgi:single-stranded-DNA-specific exonuclease